MNIRVYLSIIAIVFLSIQIKSQEAIPSALILDKSLSAGDYNYKASQSITLKPGFTYKATSPNKLTAFLDRLNLNPNPYPNEVLME